MSINTDGGTCPVAILPAAETFVGSGCGCLLGKRADERAGSHKMFGTVGPNHSQRTIDAVVLLFSCL
jgi:hypothetical protein